MFEAQDCIEIILASDGLSRSGRIYANNGTHLIIATESDDSAYYMLGANVTLVHLLENSLYKMETLIIQCSAKGIGVPIRMAHCSERRRAPRARCEMGIFFTAKDAGEGADSQIASLLDISLTGARLFTSEALELDATITLEINLEGSPITPQAQIIRCTPLKPALAKKHTPLAFDVALRFTTVPRLDQMHLHRYMVRNGK